MLDPGNRRQQKTCYACSQAPLSSSLLPPMLCSAGLPELTTVLLPYPSRVSELWVCITMPRSSVILTAAFSL